MPALTDSALGVIASFGQPSLWIAIRASSRGAHDEADSTIAQHAAAYAVCWGCGDIGLNTYMQCTGCGAGFETVGPAREHDVLHRIWKTLWKRGPPIDDFAECGPSDT
eukprot:2109949-Karenia_brevis.AAC.1